MLFQCWSTVFDAGPTLKQRDWANSSCLLGAPCLCSTPVTFHRNGHCPFSSNVFSLFSVTLIKIVHAMNDKTVISPKTRYWTNAVLMLCQCRRRWTNIKSTLDRCLVLAEIITSLLFTDSTIIFHVCWFLTRSYRWGQSKFNYLWFMFVFSLSYMITDCLGLLIRKLAYLVNILKCYISTWKLLLFWQFLYFTFRRKSACASCSCTGVRMSGFIHV